MYVGTWQWSAAEKLSPDGSITAWDTGGTDGSRVFVSTSAGVRQLTFAQEPLGVDSWWPDGRGLLVWHEWGYCNSCNADGIRLAALSLDGRFTDLARVDLEAGGFAWSPRGDQLLIGTGGDRFVVEGEPRVVICRPAAATCRDLPRPAGTDDLTPSWSPDGRFIVFARGPAPNPPDVSYAGVAVFQESLGIWIARADGTGQEELDTPGGSYPTWSDDGRTVTFVHAGRLWRHDLYSDENVDLGQTMAGEFGRGWITYSAH
jgi:Tol biopolymer transport system component